jgi:CubicO group peptidase (beta-lactamase class C family)
MTDALDRTFAGLPTAEPDEIGLSRSGLKRLTAVMEREIERGRAPGLSMLIARNGKVGFTKTLGALSPGGPSMPLDAIFRIYSMTKPIVSVAAMMLVEDGRMLITDPVSNYIPAFADTKVGSEKDGKLDLVPLKRPITIQDLMRHTSGLSYGLGASQVDRLVAAARITSQEKTMAEHAVTLAALPLLHQPGEVWEYSLSTDILGRVIEVVEGAKLGDILRKRIFEPLRMDDTAFFIPPENLSREAKPMSPDVYPKTLGAAPEPVTAPPRCEWGGGGLWSTLGDYARFLAMLSGGGALDGERILGPRTIKYMASDHLGPDVDRSSPLLAPGHCFGLGFCVRLQSGIAPTIGNVGDYFWGGAAGTSFRISLQDSLFAILMVQAPEYREPLGRTFGNLFNSAIV